MKTTVIGAYPKISDEHQDLRRALHRHDRGELDADGLSAVLDDTTRWAIGELNWAGIDVINDGQIRWDDLLAPFARAWNGCGLRTTSLGKPKCSRRSSPPSSGSSSP